jgi:hypothetical protein
MALQREFEPTVCPISTEAKQGRERSADSPKSTLHLEVREASKSSEAKKIEELIDVSSIEHEVITLIPSLKS